MRKADERYWMLDERWMKRSDGGEFCSALAEVHSKSCRHFLWSPPKCWALLCSRTSVDLTLSVHAAAFKTPNKLLLPGEISVGNGRGAW